MSTNTTKWCYSTDDEIYHGASTEAEAHRLAREKLEADACNILSEHLKYWVAQAQCPLQKMAQSVSSTIGIAEDVLNRLDEWAGEQWEGDSPALELSTDDLAGLGRVIMDYMTAHASVKIFEVKHGTITEHQHFVYGGTLDEQVADGQFDLARFINREAERHSQKIANDFQTASARLEIHKTPTPVWRST